MSRKIIISISALMLLFVACKKDPFLLHKGDTGLCFHGLIQPRTMKVDGVVEHRFYRYDSLTYSFRYEVAEAVMKDTVFVKMNITGLAPQKDGTFGIRVSEKSTAQPGVHYDLPESYIFSAGAYQDSFPVILYRENLPAGSGVSLILDLETTPDFPLTIEEWSSIQLYITDEYYKPWCWDALINAYLGYFHPLKIQKIIESIGSSRVDVYRFSVSSDTWGATMMSVKNYFMKNEILDENGIRVVVPGM